MKKLIVALLMAASTALCHAQEISFKDLSKQLAEATSLAQVAALEVSLAANASAYSPAEMDALAVSLYNAYNACVKRGEAPAGYWTLVVLPRYITDWETSTSFGFVLYFNSVYSQERFMSFAEQLRVVKSAAEFDAAVAAYFAENLMPERLRPLRDSRTHNFYWKLIPILAQNAIRIGHPEAVNYALFYYRSVPMQKTSQLVEYSITVVAQALKAKDMNLTRANVWIESQTSGAAAPFTDAEKTVPTLMAGLPFLPDPSMDKAKVAYRSANTPVMIDEGIYKIATALKALDLNLVRANAWIESQKNGEAFELP